LGKGQETALPAELPGSPEPLRRAHRVSSAYGTEEEINEKSEGEERKEGKGKMTLWNKYEALSSKSQCQPKNAYRKKGGTHSMAQVAE
jgi:hypothetical protein